MRRGGGARLNIPGSSKKNPSVTMPLKKLRRLISAAASGKRAHVKARVS